MNRHVIVTSSAGGIGRAVVRLFRERGAYVTGIDLKDADISCDLSHSQSRQEFIAQIESMAPRVDAVVAAAGILSGFPSKVISIYFFGAVQLLQGLRPLLAKGNAPRALGSSQCGDGVW
jgi:NAD(P)-dependent dehydrogenase (short-subunit alcohol dehydrogenase family)